ncbi:MAG: hypothetical protein IJT21_08330 [Synergistaceae bacterium]|nr:hypothetical protein [Synergistaceae bacterium]
MTLAGGGVQAASTFTAIDTARSAELQNAAKFAKPDTYTGNRTLYDSPQAKIDAKIEAFNSGTVTDPYTGDELVLTKAEAKARFGSDWQKHLAESDHIHPLERIHDSAKNDPFLTNEDIKNAANCRENIEVTSRKFNNLKRSRTNQEFMEDKEYRESRELELSPEAERKAGAYNAGSMALATSGIYNLVKVFTGEKSAGEAVIDTVKSGGVGAASGLCNYGCNAVWQCLKKLCKRRN